MRRRRAGCGILVCENGGSIVFFRTYQKVHHRSPITSYAVFDAKALFTNGDRADRLPVSSLHIMSRDYVDDSSFLGDMANLRLSHTNALSSSDM